MAVEPVTIVTSISPSRLERQRQALTSWLRHGFRIISVNSTTEINLVRHRFPDVVFVESVSSVELNRTSTQYVSINILLAVLSESKSSVCGIINSDVELRTQDDFLEFIRIEASTSLVCGVRVDVDPLSGTQAQDLFGFDYFFFPAEFIMGYPEADLYLGRPYWDYWFPLVAVFQGKPIKRLVSQIVFHELHEVVWGESDLVKYGTEMISALREVIGKNSLRNSDVDHLYDAISSGQIWTVFSAAIDYLRVFIPWVQYGPLDATGMVMVSPEIIAEMKRRLVAANERERQLLFSRSWRYMAPFRYVVDKLRRINVLRRKS